MTAEEKVKKMYPNAWAQLSLGDGTGTRAIIWAADGTTRKLADINRKGLSARILWSEALRNAARTVQADEHGHISDSSPAE